MRKILNDIEALNLILDDMNYNFSVDLNINTTDIEDFYDSLRSIYFNYRFSGNMRKAIQSIMEGLDIMLCVAREEND